MTPDPENDGLEDDGLGTDGLESDGLESDGLESDRLESARPESAEEKKADTAAVAARPPADKPSASAQHMAAPQPVRRRRFGRRKTADDGIPSEEWMLSYSDMVTLLLTMFVALSLVVSYDQRPGPGGSGAKTPPGAGPGSGGMRGIIESLLQVRIASPYGDEPGFTAVEVNDAKTPENAADHEMAVIKSQDLARIEQRQEALGLIRTKLRNQQLEQFVTADVEGDGIRLNIPNSILFASGAAELRDRGPAVLRALKPVLEGGTFAISVEGHTDDVPISTEKFPSNWELSAQRAAAVVRALADAGIVPQRLEAVGFADTRPLASNATDDGRRENRRVSLFLRM